MSQDCSYKHLGQKEEETTKERILSTRNQIILKLLDII